MLFGVGEELSLLWCLYVGWLGHEVILSASYHFTHEILIDLSCVVILIGLFNFFDANLEHLFHHVQVLSGKVVGGWRRRVQSCWGRQGSVLIVGLRLIKVARHELRIVDTLVSNREGKISALDRLISTLFLIVVGSKFDLFFGLGYFCWFYLDWCLLFVDFCWVVFL